MEVEVATANEEAIRAWDGPLFERFDRYRHLILPGFSAHSDRALELHPPQPGERVLDIGCGFGDTTRQIAELVGPDGEAVGVDAAPRFIEACEAETAAAGPPNARFKVADVEAGGLDGSFDRAFSRFGTMFFANPAAALRNVREALRPGGTLCMVVWRQKEENPWMYEAERAVEKFLERNEESDEPTCGPGPFSMANADTTSGILASAGYGDISLYRFDLPMRVGGDLSEAVDYMLALGPAGEIVRLAGDQADTVLPQVTEAVSEALSAFEGPDGVVAPMSTWIVSARA